MPTANCRALPEQHVTSPRVRPHHTYLHAVKPRQTQSCAPQPHSNAKAAAPQAATRKSALTHPTYRQNVSTFILLYAAGGAIPLAVSLPFAVKYRYWRSVLWLPTWFAYAFLRRLATLEAVISLPTRPLPALAAHPTRDADPRGALDLDEARRRGCVTATRPTGLKHSGNQLFRSGGKMEDPLTGYSTGSGQGETSTNAADDLWPKDAARQEPGRRTTVGRPRRPTSPSHSPRFEK